MTLRLIRALMGALVRSPAAQALWVVVHVVAALACALPLGVHDGRFDGLLVGVGVVIQMSPVGGALLSLSLGGLALRAAGDTSLIDALAPRGLRPLRLQLLAGLASGLLVVVFLTTAVVTGALTGAVATRTVALGHGTIPARSILFTLLAVGYTSAIQVLLTNLLGSAEWATALLGATVAAVIAVPAASRSVVSAVLPGTPVWQLVQAAGDQHVHPTPALVRAALLLAVTATAVLVRKHSIGR